MPEAVGLPNFRVDGGAARLQQSLDDVERRRDACGKGAGQAAGGAVREHVVLPRRIEHARYGLVGGELHGGKRDGHGQSGGIGDVKGRKPLLAVDGLCASEDGGINGAMHLHALLDDYGGRHRQKLSACRSG